MARAADPEGKRTVGIIIKCDALDPGDEQGVWTYKHPPAHDLANVYTDSPHCRE